MPRWYAPMFHMPISSPMMKTIFGCLPLCCAIAVCSAAASNMIAASSFDARSNLRFFIRCSSPEYDGVNLGGQSRLWLTRHIGSNQRWFVLGGSEIHYLGFVPGPLV